MNIRINNTEDAVSTIAALTARTIAAGGHKGHDLVTVGTYMTRDTVLQAIRRSFTRNLGKGMDVKAAVIATGQAVIAGYCTAAKIPTAEA